MHLIYDLTKPIIFGHRGASKFAPENTIASFDQAIAQGAKAFELDTMLSKDGVPVVIHDHTLSRTTNGMGEVNALTATELQQLDAGSFYSKKFKDEKIPLLEEVLQRYRKDILINIELKNYHTRQDHLAAKVLEMVSRYGMLQQVVFSSFLPRNLRIIRNLNLQAKVALLTPGGLPGVILRSDLFRGISPYIIHPFYESVSVRYVQQEHREGRLVNVWTVNELQTAQQLIHWGIDGIITDSPQDILKLT